MFSRHFEHLGARAGQLKWILAVLVTLALAHPGCSARGTVLHPRFEKGGLLALAKPVPEKTLTDLGAIFEAPTGSAILGGDPVVVYATRNSVSLFAAPNTAYAIMRAGCLDDNARLVLEGAWRYSNATDTGLIRLFVEPTEVANALCKELPIPPSLLKDIRLRGVIGRDEIAPTEEITMAWKAPRSDTSNFIVAAHHGACKTIDDCGASENTLESIELVEPFGASVVEIDVRLSKDGVPFLYHDETFNPRLTQGPLCHGQVRDYTIAQMRAACRLKFGEEIPTLAEALETTVNDTRLAGIWLDAKEPEVVAPTLAVMAEYRKKAEEKKRALEIVIGLGSSEILEAYVAATKPEGTRCLYELDRAGVESTPCDFWGPRWTRGPMNEDVTALQGQKKRVVYWTINEPEFIALFLKAKPDGILTDRPGMLRNKIQLMALAGEQVGPQ